MKNIWITGARGFIGRYLSKYLASKGAWVSGLGHGNWPKAYAVEWGIKNWINGEVDSSGLNTLLSISGPPEYLFHLAGGSLVTPSFENPLEDYQRTVETTARLMDWIRRTSPETRIICVSSAAVYGDRHTSPIPEISVHRPFSPYGYHKAMMETLCQMYSKSFGMKICIIRLFSIYGPGLEKQLIWDLSCRLAKKRDLRLEIGGTGNEQRDWCHISDAVRLLWHIGKRADASCPVFNGGTGKGSSVKDVVQWTLDAWGEDGQLDFTGNSRPGDPKYLVADIQKLTSTGFRFKVGAENGIKETALLNKRKLMK